MVALRALAYILGLASLATCLVMVYLHEALPAAILLFAGAVILAVTLLVHIHAVTKNQGDRDGA